MGLDRQIKKNLYVCMVGEAFLPIDIIHSSWSDPDKWGDQHDCEFVRDQNNPIREKCFARYILVVISLWYLV